MKKIRSLLSIILILASITSAFAAGQNSVNTTANDSTVISVYTETISDEFYVEVSIEEIIETNQTRATSTKTGKKTYTIYNSDSEAMARFVLTGKYTYNGSTVSCTSATYSTTIYDDSWEFTSASASKSGAVATGKFTAKHYFLFVATQTVSKTITLTCDKNGNLS